MVRESIFHLDHAGSSWLGGVLLCFLHFSLINVNLRNYPRLLPFTCREQTLILMFSVFFHDSYAFSLLFLMFMLSYDGFAKKTIILSFQFRKKLNFCEGSEFLGELGQNATVAPRLFAE